MIPTPNDAGTRDHDPPVAPRRAPPGAPAHPLAARPARRAPALADAAEGDLTPEVRWTRNRCRRAGHDHRNLTERVECGARVLAELFRDPDAVLDDLREAAQAPEPPQSQAQVNRPPPPASGGVDPAGDRRAGPGAGAPSTFGTPMEHGVSSPLGDAERASGSPGGKLVFDQDLDVAFRYAFEEDWKTCDHSHVFRNPNSSRLKTLEYCLSGATIFAPPFSGPLASTEAA